MRGDLSQRLPVRDADDEINTLAREINTMLDKIEQLTLGMRTVLDSAAHDLRTPLNRLQATAEGAMSRLAPGSPERRVLERLRPRWTNALRSTRCCASRSPRPARWRANRSICPSWWRAWSSWSAGERGARHRLKARWPGRAVRAAVTGAGARQPARQRHQVHAASSCSCAAVVVAQLHEDAAARGRELQGIVQQVGERLREQLPAALHLCARGDRAFQARGRAPR